MEPKFGPLEKRIKTFDINGNEIFRRTAGYTLFDYKTDGAILEELKVEPVDEKL
jgi:hypothetical protein